MIFRIKFEKIFLKSKILFMTLKSSNSLLMQFDFYTNQTNLLKFHFTQEQKNQTIFD